MMKKYRIYLSLIVIVLITTPLISISLTDVELNQLRHILEEYSFEISLAYYNNDAYGALLDTDDIYDKYQHLFVNEDLIKSLYDEYDNESEPLNKRSLLYLFKSLAEEYIYIGLREPYEEFYNREAILTITVDDEEIAYRDIDILIYLSDDSDYREKLYIAESKLIKEELNPLLSEILDIELSTVSELGFDDYATFWQKTRETDFTKLWDIMAKVLTATDDMAKELIEERTSEILGLTISEVKPWDRGQIWRDPELDEYFPQATMITNLTKLFQGLGIDITMQPNIDLDLEDRPEKGPRAGTYTLKVPDDIRVLCKPSSGLDDYDTLLHEMGHAEHYANTEVDKYEFKEMGDIGTTESYAFLFELLLLNPTYLTEELEIPDNTAKLVVKRQIFSYIYSLRYYIAKLFYEPALHSSNKIDELHYNHYLESLPPSLSTSRDEVADAIELYRYLMEKILLFPREREDAETGYLLADESFYTVYYIKAWLLSTQLESYLKKEFGDRWYKNKSAGDFLIELWSYGETYPPEDISEILGFEELNAECLIEFIEEKYKYISN